MSDALAHFVTTEQGARVPLVQLQDHDVTRGQGVLIVTDEQRISLWSCAERERYRLLRGTFTDKWYGKLVIAAGVLSGVLGAVSSVLVITGHAHG